ncbi:MAG: HEPN domain-containing protein [Cyanobacteria bacterium P01_H01_bin.21]
MNDLSEARSLLNVAHRDLRALSGMIDSKLFAHEIFGFHVQQAAEKSLKAWISALDETFPFTHDLAALLRIIEAKGYDISSFLDIAAFNDFAGPLRYSESDDEVEPLEHEVSLDVVQTLYHYVDKFIAEQASP